MPVALNVIIRRGSSCIGCWCLLGYSRWKSFFFHCLSPILLSDHSPLPGYVVNTVRRELFPTTDLAHLASQDTYDDENIFCTTSFATTCQPPTKYWFCYRQRSVQGARQCVLTRFLVLVDGYGYSFRMAYCAGCARHHYVDLRWSGSDLIRTAATASESEQ